MSVQKVSPVFSVVTACPLIITPAETVLTYQTSASVFTQHDVNSKSVGCFPNYHAYLDVKPIQKPSHCCSNNALKLETNVN